MRASPFSCSYETADIMAQKENIPIRYFSFASARKCAAQLAVDEMAPAD